MAGECAQFGQLGEQGAAGDGADAGDALQPGGAGAQGRMGLHRVVEPRVEVGQVFVAADCAACAAARRIAADVAYAAPNAQCRPRGRGGAIPCRACRQIGRSRCPRRCRCTKEDIQCGPSCHCINCKNTKNTQQQSKGEQETDQEVLEEMKDQGDISDDLETTDDEHELRAVKAEPVVQKNIT